jgi:acetyl esterase
MPNALMLSCPILNLSQPITQSNKYNTAAGANNEDPVLRSGLISAIADAYLPLEHGIRKTDPLASPLYASDQVLANFPPTLLFASSNDPILDDSVLFNQRLRNVGVSSELFAAQNVPHAYLGLGTAGFPEAKKVQEDCILWLQQKFERE